MQGRTARRCWSGGRVGDSILCHTNRRVPRIVSPVARFARGHSVKARFRASTTAEICNPASPIEFLSPQTGAAKHAQQANNLFLHGERKARKAPNSLLPDPFGSNDPFRYFGILSTETESGSRFVHSGQPSSMASIEPATNRRLIEHEFRRIMIGRPLSEAEVRLRQYSLTP